MTTPAFAQTHDHDVETRVQAGSENEVQVVLPGQTGASGYPNWGYWNKQPAPNWDFGPSGTATTDDEVDTEFNAISVEIRLRFTDDSTPPPYFVKFFWKNVTDDRKSDCFSVPVAYSVSPEGEEDYWSAFYVYRADLAVIDWEVGVCSDSENPGYEFDYYYFTYG